MGICKVKCSYLCIAFYFTQQWHFIFWKQILALTQSQLDGPLKFKKKFGKKP